MKGYYERMSLYPWGGGLEKKIADKHIYLFMHSIQHDMFEALIRDLIEPDINNIERALLVIKKCTYETSVT